MREGLTSVSNTFSLLAVSNWLPFTWRASVNIPALALSFLAMKPPSWVCVTLIIIPALSFFSAACVHSSLSTTLCLSQQLTLSPFPRPSPLFSFVFMQRQFLVWRMSFSHNRTENSIENKRKITLLKVFKLYIYVCKLSRIEMEKLRNAPLKACNWICAYTADWHYFLNINSKHWSPICGYRKHWNLLF